MQQLDGYEGQVSKVAPDCVSYVTSLSFIAQSNSALKVRNQRLVRRERFSENGRLYSRMTQEALVTNDALLEQVPRGLQSGSHTCPLSIGLTSDQELLRMGNAGG